MDIDYKLVWLFIIGAFLSCLFYLESVITKKEVVDNLGFPQIAILVVINSIIGGVVMVTTYYGLMQFVPDWHDYLKVGIAGTTAMLGKDMVYLYYRLVKAKVEK